MTDQEKEIIRAALRHLEAEAQACFMTGNVTPSGITDAMGLLRPLVDVKR